MPPTTTPTPATRPTRPTRPTPPTRPTRPTNCPCNQNCQQPPPINCGCPCGGEKKQNVDKNASKSLKVTGSNISNSLKSSGGDLSKSLKSKGIKQNTTSSGKRDYMSEVLDNSLNNSPHHADRWQDFYHNGAKWDSFQSPQVHHDTHFHLDDPGYKVRLGFNDYDHGTMEHANDLANNHVEAYPGEIVSGENYLSKFVSPAVYGSINNNHHHGDFQPHFSIETDHGNTKAVFDTLNEFNHPLDNSHGEYHGNGFHGEHAARHISDRALPNGHQRQMEGSRRNEFAERDDNGQRENDSREDDEERSSEYERENNNDENEHRYHGNREEENQSENETKERFYGDDHDDRHRKEGYHRNNNEDEEEVSSRGNDEERFQKEHGFSNGRENLKASVDNEERNVDIDSDHKNHFVDKQRYEENGKNEEGGEQNQHGGQERESLNDRLLNDGDGEQISRQELMVSKFAGRQQDGREGMTSREDDFQKQQGGGETNVEESPNRDDANAEQTAAHAPARSEQQGGEEESALYENNNNEQQSYGDNAGIEVGSRRSPDPPPAAAFTGSTQLLPTDQEISGRVKGMISAIETSDNIGEEKKFIQHLMDVANNENEVLAHDLNLREQETSSFRKSGDIASSHKNTSNDATPAAIRKTAGGMVDKELSRMFAELSKTTSLTPSAPENTVGDTKSSVGGERQKPKIQKSMSSTEKMGTSSNSSHNKQQFINQPKSRQQHYKNKTSNNDMEILKVHLEMFMKHLSGDRHFKLATDHDSKLNPKTISSIIKDVKQADSELLKKSDGKRFKIHNPKTNHLETKLASKNMK